MRARLLTLAILLLAAAPALAMGEPLFGPKTYERIGAAPDQYEDTFDVPAAMNVVVWIQNGDGEGGSRTSSARVEINGQKVAGPSDFNKQVDLVAKVVALPKGTATLDVEMASTPGSVITIIVMPQGTRPDFTVGRLVLPYASSTGTTLSLKNGSKESREVKVMFFAEDGTPVAESDRFEIPAHGSLSRNLTDLITQGAFTNGSVEIFYVGAGFGRLFGQATVHDAITGVDSMVEVQHAGTKRIDPLDPNLKFGR